MKQMIDPKTIKIDTSNLAKLNLGESKDSYDYREQTFYVNDNTVHTGSNITMQLSKNNNILSIETPDNNNNHFAFLQISQGEHLDGGTKQNNYSTVQVRGSGQFLYRKGFGNGSTAVSFFNLPIKEVAEVIYHNLLTDKTVKTIFGTSVYSADGTGNIDLYAHDITITKGTGKAFLTVYSSKNTNIDSLDDLKTIAGATFTKSCTGYINSKVIVAITETSLLLADGTTEALTGATFVDNPTTI